MDDVRFVNIYEDGRYLGCVSVGEGDCDWHCGGCYRFSSISYGDEATATLSLRGHVALHDQGLSMYPATWHATSGAF